MQGIELTVAKYEKLIFFLLKYTVVIINKSLENLKKKNGLHLN